MGLQAPWLRSVQQKAASMAIQTKVLAGVSDMAKLMKESDFMICASGGTSWERCCLGLPGIQFVVAKNQVGIATALARAGAAITADRYTLSAMLSQLFTREDTKREFLAMTYAARSIVDGFGTRYVVSQLVEGKK
jgi:UDP-2,4-diacetamido-2,4,6-trideoxy-beta-L-altropyranose hydrolase